MLPDAASRIEPGKTFIKIFTRDSSQRPIGCGG